MRMGNLLSTLCAVAFGVTLFASTEAQAWNNRAGVLRAAELLAVEVEALDTALHNINAPTNLIGKVHHFEETVTEFVNEVRRGCTYQQAYGEMAHIRQDVGLIRDEIALYPFLLQNPQVEQENRHMRTAYRNLDHQMFLGLNANRYSKADVEQLQKDVAEMIEAHRE